MPTVHPTYPSWSRAATERRFSVAGPRDGDRKGGIPTGAEVARQETDIQTGGAGAVARRDRRAGDGRRNGDEKRHTTGHPPLGQ